jgi:hypothetical protein
MRELEQLLGLFVAAVILAAAARRVGAPYPVFLALGGALLAFLPGAPAFSVPPDAVAATPVLRPLRPPHRLLTAKLNPLENRCNTASSRAKAC